MAVATSTILAIAAISTVAAAGYTAYSVNQQGKAQQALMNYNARVAEQEAADQQRDAAIRADQQREANRRFIAKGRAIQAKQGVIGSSGSPLAVLADNAAQLELGALETQRGGSIEAMKLRQQAIYDRLSGSAARSGSRMQATGTLLSGAASAAGSYGNYRAYAGR